MMMMTVDSGAASDDYNDDPASDGYDDDDDSDDNTSEDSSSELLCLRCCELMPDPSSSAQGMQVAFSEWINSNLSQDKELQHLLPVDSEGNTLYDNVQDGILLCKLINHSCPGTIDERAINKLSSPTTSGQGQGQTLTVYEKHENLVLALSSAQSIGCTVGNIDASDLAKGTQHLVLRLLWQIIRLGLFSQIGDTQHCPGLVRVLAEGERVSARLHYTAKKEILLRWVNYHLERAGRPPLGCWCQCHDSEAYIYLLNQIAPEDAGVTLSPLHENDPERRAELMLQEADKMGCRAFMAPTDVVKKAGGSKLDIAFTANLFNTHPGLDVPDDMLLVDGNLQGTGEERAYRNWMNSVGVRRHYHSFYCELSDPETILELSAYGKSSRITSFQDPQISDARVIIDLIDCIKPGSISYEQVNQCCDTHEDKLANAKYAISMARKTGVRMFDLPADNIVELKPMVMTVFAYLMMQDYPRLRVLGWRERGEMHPR